MPSQPRTARGIPIKTNEIGRHFLRTGSRYPVTKNRMTPWRRRCGRPRGTFARSWRGHTVVFRPFRERPVILMFFEATALYKLQSGASSARRRGCQMIGPETENDDE